LSTTPATWRKLFADAVVGGGVEQVVPVDLHIKGCPPRPIDLLKGLLTLMDRATKTTAP
jgi:Ni,Fe-hydrogenase III small subunit